MKLYTYSTARQRVAEVLEEASRDGEVQIRRQDGRVYAVTPVAQSARSPFANLTGRPVKGVTSKDLLRTVREEGWARGARTLRSARAGRMARGKRRRGQPGSTAPNNPRTETSVLDAAASEPPATFGEAPEYGREKSAEWRIEVPEDLEISHPLLRAAAVAIRRVGLSGRSSTSRTWILSTQRDPWPHGAIEGSSGYALELGMTHDQSAIRCARVQGDQRQLNWPAKVIDVDQQGAAT